MLDTFMESPLSIEVMKPHWILKRTLATIGGNISGGGETGLRDI